MHFFPSYCLFSIERYCSNYYLRNRYILRTEMVFRRLPSVLEANTLATLGKHNRDTFILLCACVACACACVYVHVHAHVHSLVRCVCVLCVFLCICFLFSRCFVFLYISCVLADSNPAMNVIKELYMKSELLVKVNKAHVCMCS